MSVSVKNFDKKIQYYELLTSKYKYNIYTLYARSFNQDVFLTQIRNTNNCASIYFQKMGFKSFDFYRVFLWEFQWFLG